jgi:hypothetical protein
MDKHLRDCLFNPDNLESGEDEEMQTEGPSPSHLPPRLGATKPRGTGMNSSVSNLQSVADDEWMKCSLCPDEPKFPTIEDLRANTREAAHRGKLSSVRW